METLPQTITEEAVDLYHRYIAARREFLRLETQLQDTLRNPETNLTEYWKRLRDDNQDEYPRTTYYRR